MTRSTLAQITDELENLRQKRVREIRKRIEDLCTLRKRIDAELDLLLDEVENVDVPSTYRRRSPKQAPPCGTESGYQRHNNRGESCDECRVAHAANERLKAARRRLARLSGGAA